MKTLTAAVQQYTATADRLTPSCLRVLAAVMTLTARGEPVTVRRLNRQCGWNGYDNAMRCLRRLVRCGLVRVERDRVSGKMKAGTVRPGCRFLGVGGVGGVGIGKTTATGASKS